MTSRAGYGYNIPKVGEFVRDQEANDTSESLCVVLDVSANTPASDRYIPSIQGTVADANPGYPSDAPVVTVAYANDLQQGIWNWEGIEPQELIEIFKARGIRTYDFPVPRLNLSASRLGYTQMTEDEAADDPKNTTGEDADNNSTISSNGSKIFDLSTVPEDLPLDGSGDEQYVRKRRQYLRRRTELRDPLPEALAYREIGYSSSGIAKKLDTRKQTVEKWMEEIADVYGEGAIETRPQTRPVSELE